MAGGHLGQIDVGVETDLLEVGHSVAIERVVEISGHGVGVESFAAVGQFGGRQTQTSHHVTGAVQQVGGEFAFFELLTDLFGVFRIEDSVHVRQHGSQSKSHGKTRLHRKRIL